MGMFDDLNRDVVDTFNDGVSIAVNGVSVTGIWDRDYYEVGLSEGVESTRPVAWVVSEDVPEVAQGQPVTVNGTNYVITNVQPDSGGMTALELREA